MTQCPACQDGNAEDVHATLGGLTAPFLCADCWYAAREAKKHGKTFHVPQDRDAFLAFRQEVLDA